jgi:hypothetical protein
VRAAASAAEIEKEKRITSFSFQRGAPALAVGSTRSKID